MVTAGNLDRQPSPLTQNIARLAPPQSNPLQAFACQMSNCLQGDRFNSVARLRQRPKYRHRTLQQSQLRLHLIEQVEQGSLVLPSIVFI
jgi:hypothetical protein